MLFNWSAFYDAIGGHYAKAMALDSLILLVVLFTNAHCQDKTAPEPELPLMDLVP